MEGGTGDAAHEVSASLVDYTECLANFQQSALPDVASNICFACLWVGRGGDKLNANESDLVPKTMQSIGVCLNGFDPIWQRLAL